MLGNAVWAFTYAIRWCVTDPPAQYFWLDATYIGVVAGPFCLIVFALQFTHRQHLLTRRNLFLLALEPVLILALLWTDSFHGLFYAGVRSTVKIYTGGPWFWINVIYSYAIYFLAVGFFMREYARASNLYRRQIGAIMIGMLLPWVGNFITFAGYSPFRDLDMTPFIFILSGLVFDYGLFRYHLMDIVPVAHDKLIESLPDGVLVLDAHKRIVNINPAAVGMTGISVQAIGKSAESALAHWLNMKDVYSTTTETHTEIRISRVPLCDIEVRVMPLFDERQTPSGWLILLRDITERIHMEEKLKQLSIRDTLTGLYNRTYFESELTRLELERHAPVSLFVLDVDDMKTVNDHQGHAAGDAILKRVAQVLNTAFRAEDVITRIGGDEFVVILPNTNNVAAEAILKRLRQVLQKHNAAQTDIPLNISIGFSTADVNVPLTEAFKNADADMYREKRIHRGSLDPIQ
jgi:diguanylate cyclase (GGDEF)-like protein/PAS domain S-box-containing protein